MLVSEAEGSVHLDEFSAIGSKMQSLAKDVAAKNNNEASALLEAIPAFTWRLLPEGQKPREHIETCRDSSQYYLNRVLLQAKQEGRTTSWPKAVLDVYEALLVFVASSSSSVTGVTQGPKAPVAKVSQKPVAAKPSDAAPKVELQGNKWIVEKGRNHAEPIIITPESMSQAVIIEDCENVKVRVEGKVTAVSVNRCKRLTLQVGDIVSNVEAMSTTRSDFILLGTVPTVVLDSSEGIRLLLNEQSRNTQVLSSKCAEINLVISAQLINKATDDVEEQTEIALPFQFKSVLNEDGTVSTEAVKHAGA